jgi:hypothetical protein
MAIQDLSDLCNILTRLDGLATSARFGNSPEVARLQAEIRNIAARLREILSSPDGGESDPA